MAGDKFKTIFDQLPSGWLTEGEARLLWDFAQGSGSILEVGAYKGRSSVLLANTGRQVYSVDPLDGFDDGLDGDSLEEILLSNTKSYKNYTFFRQKIEDWKGKQVELAYLDGDHTPKGTREQINKALKCGATKIAVHDVNDGGDGLFIKEVCLEILGEWDERVERLAVWNIKK